MECRKPVVWKVKRRTATCEDSKAEFLNNGCVLRKKPKAMSVFLWAAL